MFERFNKTARNVVVDAQEVARYWRHPSLEPSHLFFAVLESQSLATQALLRLHHNPDVMRRSVLAYMQPQNSTIGAYLPFTPSAKQVLELGLREALSLGNNYIGSEHLLLGCFRIQDPFIDQVLQDHNVVPERVREIVHLLQRSQEDGQQNLKLWFELP
jgi:ATP-dependent Clp protease ATP-binding subunit ClpC